MKLYYLVNDKFEYLKNNSYKNYFTTDISEARRYSRKCDAIQSKKKRLDRNDLTILEIEFEPKNMSVIK